MRGADRASRDGLSAALTHVRSALVAACLAGGLASAIAEAKGSTARIDFDSYSPRSMLELAKGNRENWPKQRVCGDLSHPVDTSDRTLAVVLMHGSAGVGRHLGQWVDALNEIGVAAFVVDSFGPRGVASTVADQYLVHPAANLTDAFQALQLLAAHPRIDPARIGVMGFSRGGDVAFRTAIEPLRRAVVKGDLRFALHIPTYAGCNLVYLSPEVTKAPILNLLGAADDYTIPGPCQALAAAFLEAGASVKTIVYPRANHGWDSLGPPTYLRNALVTHPCGVITWSTDTWKATCGIL